MEAMEISDQSVPVSKMDGSDLSGPHLRADSQPGEVAGVLDPPPAPVRPYHEEDEVTPPAIDVTELEEQARREKKSS
jgi:hypothetical protein